MAPEVDWRDLLRPLFETALRNHDQEAFESLLVGLIPVTKHEEIAEYASELLAEQDHDVQMWWLGECNCDGHLN